MQFKHSAAQAHRVSLSARAICAEIALGYPRISLSPAVLPGYALRTTGVKHSYYWRRGGILKATKTEGSAKLLPMHVALKDALVEWKSLSLYTQPQDFVFASHRRKGRKPLDLAAVLKRKIRPAFDKVGITGVGWHTFRHTVGTMLAEMGNINSPSATTCVTATFM